MRAAASNKGAGCGFGCGVVSPLITAPAELNNGVAFTSTSVNLAALLVTMPQPVPV